MKRYLLVAVAITALAGAVHAQPAPSRADKDHDGSVTFSEFQAAQADRGAKMLAMLDADKDGKVSQAEFAAMAQRWQGQQGDASARAQKMFDRMDADHDGFVTQAEITAAADARFNRADANHDGVLSKDELEAMRPKRQAK